MITSKYECYHINKLDIHQNLSNFKQWKSLNE